MLPDWPALMDKRLACAYLLIGENSLKILTSLRGVKPVDMGLDTKRWRRRDLDPLLTAWPKRAPMLNLVRSPS
ncbi:MAG: hypothetical protein ACYDD1_17170 [Caulobacteraceae bacterium]